MSYRIGIDIGGTFTDFALVDDSTGIFSIHKQLTTPRDPSVSVLEGIGKLLARSGAPIVQITSIIHGSTLVTNAVIERKGSVTGMLTTRGFKDALDIGSERRYDLYDLRLKFPAPMVPRALRYEITERTRDNGEIVLPADLDEVERAVSTLIDTHKIESLAICFLHSFTNQKNEIAVADFIRKKFPKLYLSSSAEVFPYIREFARWTTTAINAFTQPMVDRYLSNLEDGLKTIGFGGKFYIITSSGGTVTTETARRFPVRMLESGPAAGVLMSAHHGKSLGLSNILSFDMGGTTAKGAIVKDGVPRKVYELEVARVHEFKEGSGLPAKIPCVDMIEIGSGGGSIAEPDDRGLLRVGPRSAGADPGPACYGRGGTQPTLSDANVLLGYYDPDHFLGGNMKLDLPASRNVIKSGVGDKLGVDVERAAWGIHEIINEDVARAFRVHASEIGFDYRNCSMIAFGGSGPAHALRIARKLRIPRVIFPVAAGVMSAIGMLVSPLSFELAKTFRVFHRDLTPERFTESFKPIVDEASAFLLKAGLARKDIKIIRHLDMRYKGQGYEIEIEMPDIDDPTELLPQIPALFAKSYAEVFSLSYIDHPIEIVNWKVEARGATPIIAGNFRLASEGNRTEAIKGSRLAYFEDQGGYVDCPVYDRYALKAGATLKGPAFIEENEATVVVGVGDRVRVDQFLNLVGEIEQNEASS